MGDFVVIFLQILYKKIRSQHNNLLALLLIVALLADNLIADERESIVVSIDLSEQTMLLISFEQFVLVLSFISFLRGITSKAGNQKQRSEGVGERCS